MDTDDRVAVQARARTGFTSLSAELRQHCIGFVIHDVLSSSRDPAGPDISAFLKLQCHPLLLVSRQTHQDFQAIHFWKDVPFNIYAGRLRYPFGRYHMKHWPQQPTAVSICWIVPRFHESAVERVCAKLTPVSARVRVPRVVYLDVRLGPWDPGMERTSFFELMQLVSDCAKIMWELSPAQGQKLQAETEVLELRIVDEERWIEIALPGEMEEVRAKVAQTNRLLKTWLRGELDEM